MPDGSSNNPYIRTYAKDVAALSGKSAPVSSSRPAAPTEPAAAPSAPAPATAPAIDAEREATLARLRERALKNPLQQGEFLPHAPLAPMPKATPVGSPEPPPLAPPAVVTPPPLPHMAPIQPVPRVAPLPEPVPAEPAPKIEVPPAPKPQPLPTPPPVPPAPVAETPAPSPIHTYTSDFADRIDDKRASAFSVLAAQADTGAQPPRALSTPKPSRRGAAMIAGSAFLIILGGAGAYAAYRYVGNHASVTVQPSVPSLVFADERVALSGEGSQLQQALAASAETPLPDGQVRVVYLTQSSTTPDGKTVEVPLAGGRLIGALQLAAPDILLRNISPESTVGIVHAGRETRPFFILKVLSYERTFAGMLQWEGTMPSDLGALFPYYPIAAPPMTASSTASTTAPISPPALDTSTRFIDEVASNHDVRALKDSQGDTVLLYGYKDKETLIVARDEAAFAELLNRLTATKQQ